MATRYGAVDVGLVLWLKEQGGLTPHEVAVARGERSGLRALVGSANMRVVEAAVGSGVPDAILSDRGLQPSPGGPQRRDDGRNQGRGPACVHRRGGRTLLSEAAPGSRATRPLGAAPVADRDANAGGERDIASAGAAARRRALS